MEQLIKILLGNLKDIERDPGKSGTEIKKNRIQWTNASILICPIHSDVSNQWARPSSRYWKDNEQNKLLPPGSLHSNEEQQINKYIKWWWMLQRKGGGLVMGYKESCFIWRDLERPLW